MDIKQNNKYFTSSFREKYIILTGFLKEGKTIYDYCY